MGLRCERQKGRKKKKKRKNELRWERRKGREKENRKKEKERMNWDDKGEKEEKKEKERTNWRTEKEERKVEKEKKKRKKKRGEWSQKLQLVGPSLCVYLQKCHHNSVFITWKHIKFVFSLYNSSLKNQIIKLWKQKLKTSSNKPFSHGTHIFWVMGDGNTKTKQPLRN